MGSSRGRLESSVPIEERIGTTLTNQASLLWEATSDAESRDADVIPGGVVHQVAVRWTFVKALDVFHPVREVYL